MGQQEQQTPSAFVKAAIAAEREQWTGVEVTELSGEEAAEAISEFSGLELAPLYLTEHEQKLARADLLPNTPRSIARADMRGELLTNQGATK